MDVKIQIKVKPKDALFIGGGSSRSGIGVDAATVRRLDGCLIIPGSTFKGKFRNECERIARAFGIDVCHSPVPENMCPHYFFAETGESYCEICRIFGSPWLRSSLKFNDLVWQMPDQFSFDEWKRIKKTEVRPGVSISRYTRAKKEQELFFIDAMQAGIDASFEGEITGRLNSKKALALLICGLKAIFAVGGMKSRGLGWIEQLKSSEGYKIANIEFSDSDLREELMQWQKNE